MYFSINLNKKEMRRKFYVYVNWKTKDIVSTNSCPGITLDVNSYTLPGRKAKKLFSQGYQYFGWFKGWDVTNLVKRNDQLT
jgi:hypothetical protein